MGTEFGCCDDGKTSRKDKIGSNCINYKGNVKSVYVLGSFGIKPWNYNQNNKPYFEIVNGYGVIKMHKLMLQKMNLLIYNIYILINFQIILMLNYMLLLIIVVVSL